MRELVKLHRADTGRACWVDTVAVVTVMMDEDDDGSVLGIAGLPQMIAVRESVQEVLAAMGLSVETL